MTEKKPTIGVIGLGPVGSILTAHLAKRGEEIVAEDIATGVLLKIKQEGLHISGFKTFTEKIDKTANSVAELARFNPEIIFIATKACILREILPQIKQMQKTGMKIVSFQNGLGNEQLISETLGIDTTYRVVINYAGNTVSPGYVRMNWFQPPNYIGAYNKGEYTTDETSHMVAELLTASGLKTEETPNVKKHVWEKTILNSALCSICAVTGQTMKEAMDFNYTYDIAVKILQEGLEVAEADGYTFGQNAIEHFISYLRRGGPHKPSMLIDVEQKRPTEVDFMSGATARYGEKYGISTPVNKIFTHILKGIESRYLDN